MVECLTQRALTRDTLCQPGRIYKFTVEMDQEMEPSASTEKVEINLIWDEKSELENKTEAIKYVTRQTS